MSIAPGGASAVRLVCPLCHGALDPTASSVTCTACGASFPRTEDGYLLFDLPPVTADVDDHECTEAYGRSHGGTHRRLFDEYIRPLIEREPAKTVLDVGCFVGEGVISLLAHGYDANASDILKVLAFWRRAHRDPARFVCADSTRGLPYADDTFDFVISTGVIEHIGTKDGHADLRDDYMQCRQRYAAELLRVTRPRGRVLLSAPNKRFPVDLQHGPSTTRGLRVALYARAGIHVHPIVGRSHLPTYAEVRRLFSAASRIEALPLAGYFGFASLDRPRLRPLKRLAGAYVRYLPKFLRETFLNPYVLVLIRK